MPPDISMCSIAEDKCSKALVCYRRMAKPNPYWQSYSLFTGDVNKKGCRGYIPLHAEAVSPKLKKLFSTNKELTKESKRKSK